MSIRTIALAALAFVGDGIFIFVAGGSWLIAIATIVIFGFCAAMVARMLVLRARSGHGP